MKITLMYNPKAGEDKLPVEDLIKRLEKRGAEVFAQSTKEDGYKKALDRSCDFIIIAGGDGTIEKVAKKMIHKHVPIAILPYGNANNIAGSLDADSAINGIFKSWKLEDFRIFTVGSVSMDKIQEDFLESVGWGLFSDVLKKARAEKKKKKSGRKVNKVKSGMEKLSMAVQELQPSYYDIILDGVDYSGEYLWVEVMNTRSIGPQLQLAPEARHGDEFLDVVLIKEDERDKLRYFFNVQNGENNGNIFSPLAAKDIKVRSNQPIHIDDELFEVDDTNKQWAAIKLLPQSFLIINA